MSLTELQIDRLVGPTHHFGGLGVGNLASQAHAGQESNPAAAALQGLDKMRLVARYGAEQLVLPPQMRPRIDFLRSLGFEGTNEDVLRRVREEAPMLLSAATSCSAMWTANAATVTPGVDSQVDGDDGPPAKLRTQLTIANLVSSLHRFIEPDQTAQDLRLALPANCRFHGPIPHAAPLRDEGAANHMRLGTTEATPGVNIFVHGDGEVMPDLHWPRQTIAACRAIARLHKLPAENTFYLQQHPRAIDAGAFHNDVVAISHHDLLIHHELAFRCGQQGLEKIEDRFAQLTGRSLRRIEVPQSSLSIEDAVATYLFNSQIVSPAESRSLGPIIICPSQVETHPAAIRLVKGWCEQGIFHEVQFVDLSQSMSGGGGPACLRLRVPIASESAATIGSPPRWSDSLDQQLREVIQRDYVSRLTLDDLARPEFHADASNAQARLARTLASRR